MRSRIRPRRHRVRPVPRPRRLLPQRRSSPPTRTRDTEKEPTPMSKFATAAAVLALLLAPSVTLVCTQAHEGHPDFSAGEPGDPKKPARTVRVLMHDDGKE